MSHGAFRIGGVTSSRDRQIFVRLPAMIHRHDERWVPPLSADMLESNLAVRSEMERLGGQIYKRFRVYRKVLAPA